MYLHSRSVSHRCEFSQADGQWPPLRQHNFRTPHHCRGEHRSSAPAGGAIRCHISNNRYCGIPTGGNGKILFCTRALNDVVRIVFRAIPTGDNGNSLFCTHVLFHIAANIHRRTANGRPYGCDYKTVLSFREWQNTENLRRIFSIYYHCLNERLQQTTVCRGEHRSSLQVRDFKSFCHLGNGN